VKKPVSMDFLLAVESYYEDGAPLYSRGYWAQQTLISWTGRPAREPGSWMDFVATP
jgi:hypothetical protein